MADISIQQLRYFVAVAEDLHFTAGADRMHVAQPALSKSIRRMENALGFPLFNRTARGVTLTAPGRALLHAARTAVTTLDEGLQEARAAYRPDEQTLRVGYHASISGELLQPIIDRFSTLRPAWRVHLRVVDWADPAGAVLDGRSDAAMLRLPVPGMERLEVDVIRRERRFVALAARHPLARRRSVRLADLQVEPFVALPTTAGPLREFWLAVDEFDAPPRIATEASNAEDWLAAIASGAGVGMLAESTTHSYGRPDVVFVPVDDASLSELAIAWRRTSTDPIVRDYVRACLEAQDRSVNPSRRWVPDGSVAAGQVLQATDPLGGRRVAGEQPGQATAGERVRDQ